MLYRYINLTICMSEASETRESIGWADSVYTGIKYILASRSIVKLKRNFGF